MLYKIVLTLESYVRNPQVPGVTNQMQPSEQHFPVELFLSHEAECSYKTKD